MNRAVFDASALLKFVVQEHGREETRRVFDGCDEPVAPSWGLIECAHALWRKARRNEHPADGVEDAYGVLAKLKVEYIDAADAVPTALALALRLDHSVYDCLYIALAMQEAAPLVTADAKLAALAERCGVEVCRIGAEAQR